jgi:hypothetical protein
MPEQLSPAAQFMLNAAFHQHQQHDHLIPTPNAPVPTPLSPAAQAVLDAYGHCLGSYEAQVNTTPPGATRLAAALCAIADQVVPETEQPGHVIGFELGDWDARRDVRSEILDIADELRNQP